MKPLHQTGHVAAFWRAPFAQSAAMVRTFGPDATVLDIVQSFGGLPIDFLDRGIVRVGEHEIDRARWIRVRLKPGTRITLHYALRAGGDDGGGKAVLGIVLAIATILTAGLASAGMFATAGGWFAAGSLSAKLLATGISLAGALADAAITPPPAKPKSDPRDQDTTASLQGNVLAAGAPIQRVVGTRRLFPPLGAQPLTYRDGKDEVVEAFYVLAGPHDLSEIRIGDTPIADAEDVEYELREGWPDDEPLRMVTRYSTTKTPSLELSQHIVLGDEQDTLEQVRTGTDLRGNDGVLGLFGPQPAQVADPSKSLPKWHSVSLSPDCDEGWLHFVLPEGLQITSSPNQKQSIPFRIRMRASPSDPWINLPEIHFTSASAKEIKPQVILRWGDPIDMLGFSANEGWTIAWKSVPGQAGPPATDAWNAHSSFSEGAGNDSIYAGNEWFSRVTRVQLGELTAMFFLDPAQIPKGRYQVEIKRGCSFVTGSLNKDSYAYGGTVRDFFSYYQAGGGGAGMAGAKAKIPRSRENVADRAYVVRVVSVYNEHPVDGGRVGPGMAIIAVRARNRAIENLSVLASGYVRDWDGAAWTNWTTTSNPAPHFRDVMRGDLSPDPLDLEMIDDASLVAWRQACIDEGYTCDHIAEGDSGDEVLMILASCGYARPRASETWGVIRDYDRSGEDPVQVFTERNSNGVTMAKAFARLPDAISAVWAEPDELDETRELLVFRPGKEGVANPLIEEITYQGVNGEAQVQKRVEFDLAQAQLRSTFWSWSAPIEALRAARGDLVQLNHPVIDRWQASARTLDVLYDDGAIVGLILDSDLQFWNEPDFFEADDIFAVDDWFEIGLKTAIGIRRSDGSSSVHSITGGSSLRNQVEFAFPLSPVIDDDDLPTIREDCLVWIGPSSIVARRLVLVSATYDAQQTASLTAVDEAPELFEAA